NLSLTCELAKPRATGTCSWLITLMAKWLQFWKISRLGEWVTRLHITSGGSSDREVKELMVSPTARPSGQRVVTMATPVGKWPSAWRKARLSITFGPPADWARGP